MDLKFSVIAKNLTVSFDNKLILDNVDFSVGRGEFVGVVGRSGAGKTTLLKAIAGLILTRGCLDVSSNIGMVFQDFRLLPWKRSLSNVELACRSGNKKSLSSKAMKSLKIFHLQDRFPHQMSGGEKQRVAFARALVNQPDLILCDEAFGQLDVVTRAEMQGWLLNIRKKLSSSVVFCTHSLEESILLCDRILILDSGRITGEYKVPFGSSRDISIMDSSDFFKAKSALKQLLTVRG